MGEQVGSVIDEPKGDRRFKDDAWRENEVFDFIRQSYLLSARFFTSTVNSAEGLDPKTAQKVDFYTRQFVDAMSPANFALTNPEVLRRTAETGRHQPAQGPVNLLSDLERGKGKLRIRMTDDTKFKVGENIAVTPGKVVFETPLMQLIQYNPTRRRCSSAAGDLPALDQQVLHPRPAPEEQLHPLGRGPGPHRLRGELGEPDESLAEKGFDDYMREGVLAALDAIEQATGEREVNAIGYCLGGTLLATTLAHMAVKKDNRVKSATYFVTMTDFRGGGRARRLHRRGAAEGPGGAHEQARLPRWPRDGDHLQHAARQRPHLVLRGEQLPARPGPLPLRPAVLERRQHPHAGKMHSFYLRRMYQANDLIKPARSSCSARPSTCARSRCRAT
jgi:polyhydroxyalkanoate synthase